MKAINKNNQIRFKNKREVGNRGEDIACSFLASKGYEVIERNYLKKWGEIDIIAVKDSVLTFIEVKSIIDNYDAYASDYRPEENVHALKQVRLKRTMQTYMAQHRLGHDVQFLFHVVIVRMNMNTHRAKAMLIENIIL